MELDLQSPPGYVVKTDSGVLQVAGTRIALDVVVHAYRDGEPPETIVDEYPSLTLDQVFGVIAFYLRNREAVDAYLVERRRQIEQLRQESLEKNRELRERLAARRDEITRQATVAATQRVADERGGTCLP